MYSIVLMTALTGGAPDVGFDPLFHRSGCGCSGYGYAGYGTSFGCIGHVPAMRPPPLCFTAPSCGCGGGDPVPNTWIAQWGPRCGMFGWTGASCLGALPPQHGCSGGCLGSYSYWAPPTGLPLYTYHGTPWATVPEGPPNMVAPAKAPDAKPNTRNDSALSPAPATVRVTLPEGAVLYVNGLATKQTGPAREFVTPPLVPGARYAYEARAEILVGGKLEVEERQIVVTAGGTVSESFPKLAGLVRTAGDRVTGK
jgi:uncharacterized protein (TIGR03000 family)